MNNNSSETQLSARLRSTASLLGRGGARLRNLAGALSIGVLHRTVSKAIVLLLALLLAGSSAPTSLQARNRAIKTASALPDFNFVAWEVGAIGRKVLVGRRHSLDGLTEDTQVALVRTYLSRREQIGRLEEELNRTVSQAVQDGGSDQLAPSQGNPEPALEGRSKPDMAGSGRADSPDAPSTTAYIQRELTELRRQQSAERPRVEAILERQVRVELIEAGLAVRGFVWPPVQFTFIEPPLKLTVSPRERISTIHSRVLQTEYDPVTLGESEKAIEASANLSAHISRIGGMAVYPAMVVEQASLQWVLSTVAHEWTHHYLFLFPLGLRYATSDEVTTLNETVSEIIGEEVGERLARRYYREALPPTGATVESSSDESCSCNIYELWSESFELTQQRWERPGRPLQFDFQRAMRETRLHVDALLEAGLVETAEAYMEARRRYFVAHGYPLRVLNQAYFAFNGNYATGAASSSPIGPQLQRLRAESDDLAHFLETVRWFTSLADLEKALEQFEN